jgi:cytoskeletal protein CcmA (bactofilin family)
MSRYTEKLAEKSKIPYMKVERIYLGDTSTYIESTGQGTWQIKSPKSIFKIQIDGSIYISGNVKIDSPLEVKGEINCDKTITSKEGLVDKSKEIL